MSATSGSRRVRVKQRRAVRTLLRFLLAITGLVLTACAGVEDEAAIPSNSRSGNAPTATTTESSRPPVEPECSAATPPVRLVQQEALPKRVAEMREAVLEAAVVCDFEHLEGLARANGGRFTFTFGDARSAGAYWREQEAAGGEPLRFLAEMLQRPFGEVTLGEGVVYVWPSAATYEGWAQVPPEARHALRPLYGDEDFALFEEFGAYIGYRAGITDSGEWIYFVAGD
jgi:hypothetical protein